MARRWTFFETGSAPSCNASSTTSSGRETPWRAPRAYFGHGSRLSTHGNLTEWDSAALLSVMVYSWRDVFRQTLGHTERSLVGELLDWRNKWAHQERFSSDDAERALDSAARLLMAISAPQADEVARMRSELRRLVIDEQTRSEQRKAGGSLIAPAAGEALRPWREVVTPHADVASGRYQQAEFAADLWQVHLGEGGDEYRDPVEFFRRTFLTESLRLLLVGGVQRLTGCGGDPVVQLQTNFGGGKTHSMLALYHLFAGAPANSLPGIDGIMAEAGASDLPVVRRVVLVGNKISPGNPVTKPDGTQVHTLWGELAYQLGGAAAYARLAADDQKATNPGDTLRELFNDYGPVPDPHRRVGRLRAPAPRRPGPAGRHLRDAVHLRPGAYRGGAGCGALPAAYLAPRLGYHRLAPRPGGRRGSRGHPRA